MKKRFLETLSATLLVFATGSTSGLLSPASAQSPEGGPAFTAQKIVNYYWESGAENMTETRVEVFRADGSYAVLQKRHLSATPEQTADTVEMLRVLDKQADVFFTAYPEVSMVSSVPGRHGRAPLRLEDTSCGTGAKGVAADPSMEPSSILGYRVVKRTVEMGEGDSYNRLESWLAPELGCYTLREVDTRAGGRVKRSEEVVAITPGASEESLFRMAADYKEVPPSEAVRALETVHGRVPKGLPPGVDAAYQQQRASR